MPQPSIYTVFRADAAAVFSACHLPQPACCRRAALPLEDMLCPSPLPTFPLALSERMHVLRGRIACGAAGLRLQAEQRADGGGHLLAHVFDSHRHQHRPQPQRHHLHRHLSPKNICFPRAWQLPSKGCHPAQAGYEGVCYGCACGIRARRPSAASLGTCMPPPNWGLARETLRAASTAARLPVPLT